MTVYVDNPIFPYRGQMYCHMATDGNIEELHSMAAKLGLKSTWLQNKPGHPHYDISSNKRILAIKYGAIEVNTMDMIKKCFKNGGAKCAGVKR